MIFSFGHKYILNGSKTQTRRPKKPELYLMEEDGRKTVRRMVDSGPDMIVWQVGRSISVQPHYGGKSIGRIMIDDIRIEPVQAITREDCIREGISKYYNTATARKRFRKIWNEFYEGTPYAWDQDPEVFILDFHLLYEVEQ